MQEFGKLPFGYGKKVSLSLVVLQPKVLVIEYDRRVEGIDVRELRSLQRSKHSSLRRVSKLLDHESDFSLISPHSSRELILVYESQLSGSGV